MPLTRDRFEGGIDFAPGSGVHDLDLHPHRARAAGRSVEEPTRALANVVMTSTSIRPVTPTSTGVQSRLGPPLVDRGPCNCLSAARPSIFCLNVLFRSAPWKSRLFRAPWQHVTALARWLVTARRLRAKPLHRAHVCVRKDAWSSPWLEGDRAGWLKRLRRTLRFLLPTSGEAIVLDFVQPRLIHSTRSTSSLPSMSPKVVLGI